MMPHDPLSELKRLVRCGHTGPIKLGPMSSTVLVRGMLPWECVAPEDLTLTMADDLWFARIVCAPNGMQHLMRDPSKLGALRSTPTTAWEKKTFVRSRNVHFDRVNTPRDLGEVLQSEPIYVWAPSRVAAIQLARRRVTVSRFSPPVDDEYRWLVP